MDTKINDDYLLETNYFKYLKMFFILLLLFSNLLKKFQISLFYLNFVMFLHFLNFAKIWFSAESQLS